LREGINLRDDGVADSRSAEQIRKRVKGLERRLLKLIRADLAIWLMGSCG